MQNKIQLFTYNEQEFYTSFPKILSRQINPNPALTDHRSDFIPKETIKILMVGDVVGKPGRHILKKILPQLRACAQIDFVTINAENLAGGFGITEKIYDELCRIGIDVFTMGNHWKDKPDIHLLRRKYNNIVLPHNLTSVSDVDKVFTYYLPHRKININIINLMGNFAMRDSYKNPFDFLNHEKENFIEKLKSGSHIMIADIHAEASSEKQAIAWLYDGILAGLVGTHTHTPTADERITAKGTAFMSDVGMTGAYDSVIGMEKEPIIKKLSSPTTKFAHEVAKNDVWFCGFLVEVNQATNLAQTCYRLQCRTSAEQEETWLVSKVG